MSSVQLSYALPFLYSQLFVKPAYPTMSFAGQTIIVTGSNVGLGFEAAQHIVRLEADKVILAVRNLEKGEVARKSIDASTQRPGVAEVWHLDMASYESIREFVRRAKGLPRLDALLANAGIMTATFRAAERDEETLTVNVVSTFLLALLLLPKLRETAVKFNVLPRLAVVSSEVHFWAAFKEKKADEIFKALNDKERTDMMDRYFTSKLLQVLIVREMAKLMSASDKPKVVLNCPNPGLCVSELMRDEKGLRGLAATIMKSLFGRTTEVGSRTLVAGVNAGEESHGKYMSDGHVAPASNYVQSQQGKEDGKRVWDELAAKLEAIEPGVSNNV